jgi:hypothetical protein
MTYPHKSNTRLQCLQRHLNPPEQAGASEIPAVDKNEFMQALRAHQQCYFMKDAVDRLGPVVQLAPKLILCTDPDGIRELTALDKATKTAHEKRFVPYAWYDLPQDTMVALNGEPWRVRRQV